MIGCHPQQEVLHGEQFANLTDMIEGDRTSFFDLTDHVPPEIRAHPHDTLHEIVPGLVIVQILTPHFGCCFLCPPRQLLVLEPSFPCRLSPNPEYGAGLGRSMCALPPCNLPCIFTKLERLLRSLPGSKSLLSSGLLHFFFSVPPSTLWLLPRTSDTKCSIHRKGYGGQRSLVRSDTKSRHRRLSSLVSHVRSWQLYMVGTSHAATVGLLVSGET